ncbi:MAG: four helix bundle protein [Gemmatimonadaceae bacterium]|nr:four helix bundle protein [Gemmatimonadaceae bacterium]
MQPFRRLAVWEKAHELTLRVFRLAEEGGLRRFPGLSAQLCRSAAAIPTNIAEGSGHVSPAQFKRFLEIALASACETDYQLLLARDLDLIGSKEYAQLEARLSEVRAMLMGLRKRVAEKAKNPHPEARK